MGSHLARLMLRESFDVLMAWIESFELAYDPSHLMSNEIAGVVSFAAADVAAVQDRTATRRQDDSIVQVLR